MGFAPASRKNTFALIGMTALSGRGKTYSALRLARGLVGPKGKIALLDTENGRGSIYSDLTPYDVDELWAPFTPERYAEQVRAAIAGKYDCLIIDSCSHEWEGVGGVVQQADESGKKGLQKWLKPKTDHKKFLNVLLQSRMHVILCMRGKYKLVQVGNDIVNQGIVPIQDSRLLYEMTVSIVFDEKDEPGMPTPMKCPANLLSTFPKGKVISEKTGEDIAKWLGSGATVDHALESLKAAGREEAGEGLSQLMAWWNLLTKEQKVALALFKDTELKSIAKAADDLAAQAVDEPTSPTEDVLSDTPRRVSPLGPLLDFIKTHSDTKAGIEKARAMYRQGMAELNVNECATVDAALTAAEGRLGG